MLPKANRLTKKKDFELVFKEGKSIKNDFLVFKILKNHLKIIRFGFVVSKKVSNKANQRNKIKRRLRAAVLSELKNIRHSADKKFMDVVIIALSSIANKKFPEIQAIITKFFKKIN